MGISNPVRGGKKLQGLTRVKETRGHPDDRDEKEQIIYVLTSGAGAYRNTIGAGGGEEKWVTTRTWKEEKVKKRMAQEFSVAAQKSTTTMGEGEEKRWYPQPYNSLATIHRRRRPTRVAVGNRENASQGK